MKTLVNSGVESFDGGTSLEIDQNHDLLKVYFS